ncbi:MAG: hypothetical protein AAGF47_10355 [Planctomycetota bacterium]
MKRALFSGVTGCVVASAASGQIAVSSALLEVFDFGSDDDGNGFPVFDTALAFESGILASGVDTDGGLDDTAVAISLMQSQGIVALNTDAVVGGNGAWSALITFELEDPTGLGWIVEEEGFISTQFTIRPDDSNPILAGTLTETPLGTVASAGLYTFEVFNPFFDELFDPKQIFDDSWTNASGLSSITLTLIPGPGSSVVFSVIAIAAARRHRNDM